MRKSRPSTYDVAKQAHVSVSTVSRVINGHKGVDERTRSAVWAAINGLGYEVVRKSDVLTGILVLAPSASFSSTYWQLVMSGILEEASRIAIPVMFSSVADRITAQQQIRSFATRDGILGVVCACFPADISADGWIPDDPDIVSVSILMQGSGHSVNIDMYQASFQITRKLIKLGHRRTAMAVNSIRWWAQSQRLHGYLDALRAVHAQAPSHDAFQTVPVDQAKVWLEQQLADPAPPTAIIGGTSELSRLLFAELHRLKVKIPQELSFVGVGHVRAWDEPLFDTVTQPTFELGVEAVRALRHVATRPDGLVTRSLEAPLVRVGTLGPPS